MKTLKLILLAVFAGCTFLACSDDDDDNIAPIIDPIDPTDSTIYVGSLVTQSTETTTYTCEDANILISLVNNDSLNITMKAINFAERMPKMDICVPNVLYTVKDSITFEGNNIIPIAMGGEFPAYMVTNLTGYITGDSLHFSMTCGSFPVSYKGGFSK